MMKIFLSFFLLMLCIKLTGQEFIPLLSTDKNESIYDAIRLPNKKNVVLSYQNVDYFSVINKEDKSIFEVHKEQLTMVDSIFSKLSILNRDGVLENEASFYSTKDSIFIYKQLKVVGNEIVLWGSLYTTKATTKTAIWFNFDLTKRNTIVYDYNFDFGDSFFFNINSNLNILCSSNNRVLELDRFGKLIKTFNNGFTLFPFVIDANENYIHPEPQRQQVYIYSAKSSSAFTIDENQNFERDDIVIEGFEFVLNKRKTAFYVNTIFNTGCSIFSGFKSAVLKYNTDDFSSEIFYVNPTPNCVSRRLGQFDIDLYQDDYVYFANKAENCGFLTPFIATNICEVEYINLYCLDEVGNLRWSKYLGGDALYLLNGVIATADEGCLVFVSRYEPGVNKEFETDSYYLKFDKNGEVVESLSTNILEGDAGNYNIQLYPNPVNETLYFGVNNSINQSLEVNIFNLKGQLVLTQNINNASHTAINTKDFSAGNYTYTISTSSTKIKSGKFIKL